MSDKEEDSATTSLISKRLFFALWLDEEVVQNIQQYAIQNFLNCQGRILDKNNWHITLAYFGASDADTQACLEEQAEKIISQPFELTFSKCGFWPNPKVAWLAPKEIPDTLKQLTEDLQQIIIPCGFKPEQREYQPHITLVRKAKYEPSLSEITPINLKVIKFCLVESKTILQGAQYKVLKHWVLK
ncbi:MAG: RNA 2',3'-cyclic phosphodiesterase [Gammaproteobacteria bacterium]|nr:RNA 2',3'-cyclic phosphodiesterase [Gammaproteobacteria bacterium]